MRDTRPKLFYETDHERNAAIWMDENPEIMRLYEQFANRAATAGHRFGIGALTERIRWEISVEWRGDYKINNNHRAYIARELIRRHPRLAEYIETRRTRGEV